MSATQPIRNKHQVRELAGYYLKRGKLRNYVLIVMGVHTALRISDLLRIRFSDAYDFEHQRVRDSLTIIETKTGKSKIIALNANVRSALALYATTANPDDFLFKSRKGENNAISRVQAYRIIRDAAEALDMGCVSCHSLRKTFGYHAWKSGESPAVIMKIYNHSSLAVTQRYLGITQDELDDCYHRLADVI